MVTSFLDLTCLLSFCFHWPRSDTLDSLAVIVTEASHVLAIFPARL